MFYKLMISLMFLAAVQAFANIFANVETFQATFTQNITNSSSTITYNGDIYIKKPSNILWRYKTPIIKDVYITKNTVIIDEPELEQAIYTKLDKELNLFKILKDAKKVANNHYKAEVNNTQFDIKLVNNHLHSISYKDEIENSVVINFSNIKLNNDIKTSMFEFFAPANYDIIKK